MKNELNQETYDAIVKKLGGIEGVKAFLADKSKGFPFNVWKTIEVGKYKNTEELHMALDEAGVQIGGWGEEILSSPGFLLSSLKRTIYLAKVSLKDLGIKKSVIYKDIRAKAKEFGLKDSSNEVGPQLCLEDKEFLSTALIRIAMEPIIGSGGHSLIFAILDGVYVNSGFTDHFYYADDSFIFEMSE